jgi:DNA-binding transcriptional LysR family regulator
MIYCHKISDAYGVEPQLLRTFTTVARLGSFSAAAAELGYTQAAVSQQIAALENDLRTQLLTRRPVTPTEAGARLLEHAGPILLRLDAARADITRMTKTPPNATLVIGVTPLAGATCGLAEGLATLRTRMPRLKITVEAGTRHQIAIAVAKGELDLALTDGLAAPGDSLPEQSPVTAIGLTEHPVRVVLPVDHPLAQRSTLRLPDLAAARWIEAENVAPPLEEIRKHAGVDGFKPAMRYRGEDITTLLHLASAGHGLTLLPEQSLSAAGITAADHGFTPPPEQLQGVAKIRAVSITQPRVSHRVELLHPALPADSPATALAAILTQH